MFLRHFGVKCEIVLNYAVNIAVLPKVTAQSILQLTMLLPTSMVGKPVRKTFA